MIYTSYCTAHDTDYPENGSCGKCEIRKQIKPNPAANTPAATPAPAGSRYNKGKPALSMVLEAKHAMKGVAEVLGFGAYKYSRGNWREGLSHTEICDSMLRHIASYLSGEDNDLESGLPHVNHILCNALFLAEMVVTYPSKDDRSKVSMNDLDEVEKFLDCREELSATYHQN